MCDSLLRFKVRGVNLYFPKLHMRGDSIFALIFLKALREERYKSIFSFNGIFFHLHAFLAWRSMDMAINLKGEFINLKPFFDFCERNNHMFFENRLCL